MCVHIGVGHFVFNMIMQIIVGVFLEMEQVSFEVFWKAQLRPSPSTAFVESIALQALDGFNLNTVHKLSSIDKKISQPRFEPGAAG